MYLIKFKIFGYEFSVKKPFDRNKYMKWYHKENRKKINARNRMRYRKNINGTRDKALLRAKR